MLIWQEAKRRFRRAYCIECLVLTNGNVSAAARMAGKDRKDFYDMVRATGVDVNEYRPPERRRPPLITRR